MRFFQEFSKKLKINPHRNSWKKNHEKVSEETLAEKLRNFGKFPKRILGGIYWKLVEEISAGISGGNP